MKNFRDYLSEAEHAADTPVPGDTFAINIREECLIESVVIESRSDGVLIAADEGMISLLESYGYTFEQTCQECGINEGECGCVHEQTELAESHFAVGDRVQCRQSGMKGRVVKLDKEHGAEDDQYYTVKRDDGTLKKMAPGDMTKIDEQVQEFKDELQQDLDANEYDQEGDMAKTELQTMIRSARRLQGLLGDDDNMPEWTQKKITKATDYVDTAADYIASQKERGIMEHDSESNPVARAILHRIMMQHTGMLAQYGPEQVMNAVDDVAEYIGDVEEIGTSDVSEYVRAVQQMLGGVRESGAPKVGRDFTQTDLPPQHPQSPENVYAREQAESMRERIAALQRDLKAVTGSYPGDDRNRDLIRREIFRAKEQLKAARGAKTGMAEGVEQLHPETLELIDEYISKIEPDADRDEMIQSVIKGSIHPSELEYALKDDVTEAEYQGRKVQLGKKMKGDVKKSKVYVKNPQGNVVKVNFGDPNMKIKKSNPGARKSFRARHNCDNPGPRHKARYWSCRSW